jgi:hypothetical protein
MRIPLVASSAAFLLAACATSKAPPPAVVENTGVPGEAMATRYTKVTATVQAVDKAKRTVTLKEADGRSETINVPPEVKRLDEVAVGDTVEVEVQEGLLLEYQPAGTESVAPEAVVVAERAPKSQAPGGAAAAGIQGTVTVTSIDLKSRIVQFQDTQGSKYQVKAGPKVQLERLKVGDRLLATYVAGVAVTLKKPGQK